ncbi:MAG: endopeptidase La [Spirochaetales bacterium]|nr:endopeptidase La [Spirochaetales bacterium]
MSLLGKRPAKTGKKDLPLLAVKDILVFPSSVSPFFAPPGAGVKALEVALAEDQEIFLVPQKNKDEARNEHDLHSIGVVAYILQTLRLPDGSVRVLVEGRERARLLKYLPKQDYVRAEVQPLEVPHEMQSSTLTLMQIILQTLRGFKELQSRISKDKLQAINEAERSDVLVDLLVPLLNLSDEKKLGFLLEEDSKTRLENLAVAIQVESELAGLQHEIHKKVKSRLEQSQREYYLNEQLKEIHKELGHEDGDPTGATELRQKIEALQCPADVKEKSLKECNRLARLQATTPEAGILRTYLEWITDLPWGEKTEDVKSLSQAQTVLDTDHFDMKKVKERILDYLAVRNIQAKLKGPILCLVGPPGTGKTSLGRSIARALGRSFVRISLGGVRDEAEIRGHRKTYVGALPGKILQSMKRAATSNPVFLLDEIDKMNSDFRGDPASALLEVLDPEQNSTFTDHYLEVPYDLSDVLFITTANSLHTIPRPLQDRMEVIEVPGYTDLEKAKIAEGFLIPKQIQENGLGGLNIVLEPGAIQTVIHDYTAESGVRGLERQIGQVLRKTARALLEAGKDPEALRQQVEGEEPFRLTIDAEKVREYLGLPLWKDDKLLFEPKPGLANGLAWTEVGGKVLPVEVSLFPGKGELILTGSLGDVMKESVRIAFSFLKARAQTWHLKPEDFTGRDLHIHFPEGAIPKDGPSAGITVVAALLSAFRGSPLRSGVAMTGEVTLTGRVFPIGGVKEKVLAAYRHGLKDVFLPYDNRRDLEEIPDEVKAEVTFHFAQTVEEALHHLFPAEFFSEPSAPEPSTENVLPAQDQPA